MLILQGLEHENPYLISIITVTDSMILLGSVKRFELERILWVHLSEEQKIFMPPGENGGVNSQGSTPGSSRAPTPPPRVEIIPSTPEPPKARFMVTKVNETEKNNTKRDEAVFTISRSVSDKLAHICDKEVNLKKKSIFGLFMNGNVLCFFNKHLQKWPTVHTNFGM